MQFNGTITLALPEASGVSKSGKPWRKRSYVLCYDNSNEQYPKEVLFDVLGDKIDALNIQQDCAYELEIDFSVREYQGRHYMSATAWKAAPLSAETQAAPAQQGWEAMYPERQQKQHAAPSPFTAPAEDADSLPFF